jgi:hypothetical protein
MLQQSMDALQQKTSKISKKIVNKTADTIAFPVTYLASYVIPQGKRTREELNTLQDILKLGGREQSEILVPSQLLWSGLITNAHANGSNSTANNSHAQTTNQQQQIVNRTWTVVDSKGQAKNLKASKAHVAQAFGIPLRDLHYLDPLRPTLQPANIFIRPRCLVVNLEHLKFIVTAETSLFLNADNLEVKRFLRFLRKYLKEQQTKVVLIPTTTQEAPAAAHKNDNDRNGNNEETENNNDNNNETTQQQQQQQQGQTSSILEQQRSFTATTLNPEEERVLNLPFELLVLECALHEIGLKLDNETIALEREAAPVMEKMVASVQAEELAEGRRIKEKLNALLLRLEAFTEALSAILEHDDLLDAMCLSKLRLIVNEQDSINIVRNTTATADTSTTSTTTTYNNNNNNNNNNKDSSFITRAISNAPPPALAKDRGVQSSSSMKSQSPSQSTKESENENNEHNNMLSDTDEEIEEIENPDSGKSDGEHEGAEALLEAYYMHSAATQKRANMLKELLLNTEAVSSMILDRQRNELIKIDLVITAALFACSIVSLAGGIFGMNLKSGIEARDGFFVGVIVITSVVATSSFIFIIFYCRRKGLF